MLGLATRLGDEPHVVGETAFYGLDHVAKSKRDELDYEFGSHEAASAALVSHGLFQPFDLGDWDAEEVLTEANIDFDAMLLGDNHKPGQKEVADAWVTYCGSTERCSADEREDRGYNIVEFDGDVTITRRGLDATRDFEFVSADLAEDEGIERVREKLRERDLEDAVTIVEIDGEGEDVTPARVEETALEQGALVARVKDRREIEDADEDEIDVSFADPDEAVRERVRDLGLSEAARGIDETVRESKLADSNVRESVRDRVSELVEDDLSAFESAPTPDEEVAMEGSEEPEDPEVAETDDSSAEETDTAETATAEAPTADAEETGTADGDGTATTGANETATADGDGTATAEASETATADETADTAETANPEASETATATADDTDDTEDDGTAETATSDGDDASLEEYL
jgi:DNA repair exonuclease SbcCD nuclease subunit